MTSARGSLSLFEQCLDSHRSCRGAVDPTGLQDPELAPPGLPEPRGPSSSAPLPSRAAATPRALSPGSPPRPSLHSLCWCPPALCSRIPGSASESGPTVSHPIPSMGAAPQLPGPGWLGPMRGTLCLSLPLLPAPPHSALPPTFWLLRSSRCGELDTHFLSVFKATVGCCPNPRSGISW